MLYVVRAHALLGVCLRYFTDHFLVCFLCLSSFCLPVGCAPPYSLEKNETSPNRLLCAREATQCVGVNYDADNQVRSYDWQNFKEMLESPICAYAHPSELVGVYLPHLPEDCLSHMCRIRLEATFGGKMYMTGRAGDNPDELPFCIQTYLQQVSSRVDYCSGDCYDNILRKRGRSDHLVYYNFMCDTDSTQCVHPKPFSPRNLIACARTDTNPWALALGLRERWTA